MASETVNGVTMLGTASEECPLCMSFADPHKDDCRLSLVEIEVRGRVLRVTGSQYRRILALTPGQLTQFAEQFTPAVH